MMSPAENDLHCGDARLNPDVVVYFISAVARRDHIEWEQRSGEGVGSVLSEG